MLVFNKGVNIFILRFDFLSQISKMNPDPRVFGLRHSLVIVCGEGPIELQDLKSYLNAILGIQCKPALWEAGSNLPFFLRDRYQFYLAKILKLECILMVNLREQEDQPAAIHKHLSQVQERSGKVCIYIRSKVTSYNRSRLIEKKIPFVIPGNQLYLPMLGLDLREHYRALHQAPEKFSPSTQAVVINFLLHHKKYESGDKNIPNIAGLATELGYTQMTISRALDEIEAAKVGLHTDLVGRERMVKILQKSKRDLWEQAATYLQSPVKKTQPFLQNTTGYIAAYKANLTALAHYSNLAAPVNPTIASSPHWKPPSAGAPETARIPTGDNVIIHEEIWTYPPQPFMQEGGVVDPFSLFLSLREEEDERVEAALAEMMERIEW